VRENGEKQNSFSRVSRHIDRRSENCIHMKKGMNLFFEIEYSADLVAEKIRRHSEKGKSKFLQEDRSA
jgi:hypothetical protein